MSIYSKMDDYINDGDYVRCRIGVGKQLTAHKVYKVHATKFFGPHFYLILKDDTGEYNVHYADEDIFSKVLPKQLWDGEEPNE